MLPGQEHEALPLGGGASSRFEVRKLAPCPDKMHPNTPGEVNVQAGLLRMSVILALPQGVPFAMMSLVGWMGIGRPSILNSPVKWICVESKTSLFVSLCCSASIFKAAFG